MWETPVGGTVTEGGAGLCQDQGQRPKAFLPRSGLAASLCPHPGPPALTRRPGGAWLLQGRALVSESSPWTCRAPSHLPACHGAQRVQGNLETPVPLPATHSCPGYVTSKTQPGWKTLPGTQVVPGPRTNTGSRVPYGQSRPRGLWVGGGGGQWGIDSLLWRAGEKSFCGRRGKVQRGRWPAEVRRPPSPPWPWARDRTRLAAPRRSAGFTFTHLICFPI